MIVNEFFHKSFQGLFIILVFTQWSYFLTFSLVIDSMITEEDDRNLTSDKLKTFNLVFRLIMHLMSFGLFISIFFVENCYSPVYPVNFVCLVGLIFVHQVYDIYLIRHNYMIDWEELPPMTRNKLRYNVDLFKSQAKFLMFGNIIFGTVSVAIVCFGFFVINRQDSSNLHLLCH